MHEHKRPWSALNSLHAVCIMLVALLIASGGILDHMNVGAVSESDISTLSQCTSSISTGIPSSQVRTAVRPDSKISSMHNARTTDQENIKNILVVGVMSARDHFEQRRSLRETWVGHAHTHALLKSRTVVRFIVGGRACPLAPVDRQSTLSCEPIPLVQPAIFSLPWDVRNWYSIINLCVGDVLYLDIQQPLTSTFAKSDNLVQFRR